MGIYSTNRIDGLSSFGESIDFSDPALLHGPSLMEACIEICECDQNMFETLIEFDFMSENNLRTMTESEAIALNEASDKGKVSAIIEKIKGVIGKVVAAIKSGAAKVIDKISEVIHADKRIIKKYDDTLTMDNLEGFKGIKKFAMPKDYLRETGTVMGILQTMKSDLSNVKNISISNINDIKSDSNADRLMMKSDVLTSAFEKEVEDFIPDSTQLNRIKNGMKTSKDTISKIKKLSSAAVSEFKNVMKLIKAAKRNTDDKGEAKVYATAYNIVSKNSKAVSKAVAQYMNTLKKQLSAYRKAYIVCGRYAYGKAKGKESEDATNEAVNFAITESSDVFVFGL